MEVTDKKNAGLGAEFTVRRAENGGFTVERQSDVPGAKPRVLAAFEDAAGMIQWVAQAHGVALARNGAG